MVAYDYKEQLTLNAEAYMEQKLIELEELYLAKNSDYGGSTTDTYLKYGPVSYVVRLEDKFSRLRSISKLPFGPQVEESLEDTLSDIINYCIMFTADVLSITYRDAKEAINEQMDLQSWERNDIVFNPMNVNLTNDFFRGLVSIKTELVTANAYGENGVLDIIKTRKLVYQTERVPYNIIFMNGMLIRICLRELAHLYASEKTIGGLKK